MELQTLEKLNSSTTSNLRLTNSFLIRRNYQVKPLSFSCASTQDMSAQNSPSEGVYTKDTISYAEDNLEGKENRTLLQEKRDSFISNSQLSSAGDLPKSILKNPKIGICNKKSDYYSTMHAFFQSEALARKKKLTLSISAQSTPRTKLIRISHMKTLRVSICSPNVIKKVTFADDNSKNEESVEICEHQDCEPNKVQMRLPNSDYFTPSIVGKKGTKEFFTFSEEDIMKYSSPKKQFTKARNSLLGKVKAESPIKNQKILSADSRIHNLVNLIAKAPSDKKLPLILGRPKNLKSSEKIQIIQEKTSVTP